MFGVNDGGNSWRGDVTVQRIRFDGTVLASHSTRLVVDRQSSGSIGIPDHVAVAGDPTGELLVARACGGKSALHFFRPDKDLVLPDPELRVRVFAHTDRSEVLIQPAALARHVALQADRLSAGAVSDEALVTVLPGETFSFSVRDAASFTVEDLVSTGALQHLAGIAST